MKGNVKRVVSGLLSSVTVLSAFLQPVVIQAAEAEPAAYEAEYPALDKVKDKLAKDEIVPAEDHEVEAGSDFDVEHDFSGLKFSSDKVKVTFHEAKNKDGHKFDCNRADTYKAVYFVEPASKNPSYHVCRNIVVKEKKSGESEDEEANESSLTVDSAIMQAQEQGIDLMAMEAGIVRGNDVYLYGEKVKAYLRRGARLLPGFTEYPNPQVGYGALCVRDSIPV